MVEYLNTVRRLPTMVHGSTRGNQLISTLQKDFPEQTSPLFPGAENHFEGPVATGPWLPVLCGA